MKVNGISVFALACIALTACQQPMDPASYVSKLRVLAVQADPPEVAPGEGVTHRVLYADPNGDGRDISFLWLTCVGLFTPSSDLSQGCTSLGFKAASASEGGATYEIPQIPPNILDEMPPDSTYLPATTVVSICGGGRTPDLASLASDTLSIESIANLCEGGEGLLAFKTFRISTPDTKDRNTNPTIEYLRFNGNRLYPTDPETGKILAPTLTNAPDGAKCEEDADCPEGDTANPNVFVCETIADCLEGAEISAYLTDDSFEFYEAARFNETQKIDEAPYISWFSDGGSLSRDRSRTAEPPGPFTVVWSPPQKGGTFSLYVAAHDLRGGASWQQYTITAITGAAE